MALDPTKMADWQIAEEAEKTMKTVYQLRDELGLKEEELLPHGHYVAKIDFAKVLKPCRANLTASTSMLPRLRRLHLEKASPPAAMGLVEGLGKRGKKVGAAIRQPSGGPTMNIKGSAAGGGLAQCIPLTPFSLGLTGDINAIMNAHNLAMVAVTSRLQHEFNYDDAEWSRRGLPAKLNIDPRNVEFGWIMDFCAQALRNITIGIGGKMDGFMMNSKFGIAVSSEIMAILAVAKILRTCGSAWVASWSHTTRRASPSRPRTLM